MAASREVEYIHQFNGGLNLTNQTQQLSEEETPDCRDVDFGVRGGFTLRGGFQSLVKNTGLADGVILGNAYLSTSTNDNLLIVETNGDLYEWDGSSLTDTAQNLTDDMSERVRMAEFQDIAYFANCYTSSVLKVRKWDGTTLTTMTNAFNDNYLSPSGTSGNMPLGRQIAAWNGYMWLGDTTESGTRYANRLRFSHLQSPEDWATNDWFTVGEIGDGEPITGLQPFGDRLIVFTKKSTWQVLGFSKDDFILEQVTDASGACTCRASAVNSGICYWVSTDGQVMAYNKDRVAPISEKIRWWSDIGRIQHGGAHKLMWSDGRLWCSLEAGSGESASRWTFVWDPSSQTWTRYGVVVEELFHWNRGTSADGDPLFFLNSTSLPNTGLYRYDKEYYTDLDPDGATVRIQGYYRTGWLRAGETATKKRWKRPRITAAARADTTVRVQVFYDFDDQTPRKDQSFMITSDIATSLWGTMNWGDDWSGATDETYAFVRMPSSGTARAVSYLFSSTDNPSRWWVDSVAVPFRRKQVK